MRRKLALLLLLTLTGGLFGGIRAASAHQCPEDYEPNGEDCEETDVYDDWRPNYVPLFDLTEREDQSEGGEGEQQRYDAQRWRDECNNDGEYRQQCLWLYGGQSVRPYEDSDPDGTPRPNEAHVGYAANHCFLAEGAHDCDRHGQGSEFDTHDSHGGAVYADVCLTANPDSKHCDDGPEDTQAGVTVVDHLDCPTGCLDEYHVVRPLDSEHTQAQMEDTATAVEAITSDPEPYLLGYPQPPEG